MNLFLYEVSIKLVTHSANISRRFDLFEAHKGGKLTKSDTQTQTQTQTPIHLNNNIGSIIEWHNNSHYIYEDTAHCTY